MYQVKCHNHRSQQDQTVVFENCENNFSSKIEAQNNLLLYAMNRLEITNMQNVTSRPFVFVPKTNHVHLNRHYDVAILARFCHTPDEFMHGYYIEWVNIDEVDEWNRKLRNRFGDNLTLQLYKYDCGESPEYYFQGATTGGESDYFESIEAAYEAACFYLDNLPT